MSKKKKPVKSPMPSINLLAKYGVLVLLFLSIPLTLLFLRTKQDTRSNAQVVMPVGQTGSWNMIFDDEFNTTTLDNTKWATGWMMTGISSPVNTAETACYDPALVTLPGDGSVHLGFTMQQSSCGGKTMADTGSMINSNGKFQYAYGYIEFRAYIPAASNGTIANWPALWSDGQNWPTDGENDTMEGLSAQACYHFHSPAGGPGGCSAAIFTGWHTFASDWEPGVVTYYYDGAKVGQITTGITAAPQFVIMNNTQGVVGGITSITTPATMLVDYVRVWQKSGSTTPSVTTVPTNGVNPTSPITPTYSCVGGINCIPSISPSPQITQTSPSVGPTDTALTPTDGTVQPTETLPPAELSLTPAVTSTPGTTPPSQTGFISFLLAFLLLILQFFLKLFGH